MLTKHRLNTLVALAVGVFVISGCATRGHVHTPDPDVPEPVPLTDAVQSVMAALDKLAVRSNDEPFHGLLPAEVEVVFEVQAGRSAEGGLSVKLLPAIAEIGGEWSSEAMSSEGNTITIKFRNILLAKRDELVGFKNVEDLAELLERLRDTVDSLKRLDDGSTQ